MKKIAVVHGSPRKGNSYRLANEFIASLKKCISENLEVEHIRLPQCLDDFCKGCATCVLDGEEKCPHYAEVQIIADILINADGIIVTSSVFVLGATASLKNLFDHLAWFFINHRPNPSFFKKSAIALITTAGAGDRLAYKSIKRVLKWWGIPYVRSIRVKMLAMNFDEMTLKRQNRKNKLIKKESFLYAKSIQNSHRLRGSIQWRLLKPIFKGMVTGFEDDNIDKIYWKKMGWI